MTTLNKTFSIKNGLDVANTIVLDSSRNLSNIVTANTTTINSTNFVTSAGLNVPNQANNAYAQANAAYAKANAPITVKEVYASNNGVVNTFTHINTIQFDTDSGMAVVNAASNTVTIQLNSTFKNWYINGAPELVASGLDTVNFIPGTGISITANNNTSPKSITFSATGAGGNGESSIINSDVFTGTGACTQFTLTSSTEAKRAFVYLNGVSQKPNIDYQVTGQTLTFNVAPGNGTGIEVRSVIGIGVAYANAVVQGNTTLRVTDSSFELFSNGFSTSTDSISRTYLLRGTTTNATETELLQSSNQRIPVSSNTTVFYSVDIVGRRTNGLNESTGIHLKGVVDNFNDTVADVGDLYEVVVAEDTPAWTVDARADDENNSINIYVTGENAKTIRWTALVRTVEVAN